MEIKITKHAVEQFRKRGNASKKDTKVVATLRGMISKAKKVEPCASYKVKSIIKHGFRDTTYYSLNQWIFIVADNYLITIVDRKKFGRKWSAEYEESEKS